MNTARRIDVEQRCHARLTNLKETIRGSKSLGVVGLDPSTYSTILTPRPPVSLESNRFDVRIQETANNTVDRFLLCIDVQLTNLLLGLRTVPTSDV